MDENNNVGLAGFNVSGYTLPNNPYSYNYQVPGAGDYLVASNIAKYGNPLDKTFQGIAGSGSYVPGRFKGTDFKFPSTPSVTTPSAGSDLSFSDWKDLRGGGTWDEYGQYLGTTPETSGFGNAIGWLGKNKDGIGTAMGLGGLSMNAYSQFFGQGKDYYDKQMQLLDQQIASNKDKLERRQDLNEAWATHGQGLAGSTAKGQ